MARLAVDVARDSVRNGGDCPDLDEVARRVEEMARAALSTRARRVINATGVLLHTNLGRAPLGPSAAAALAESARGYTSVELDLTTGRRGARGAFAESALTQLTGAESALVVNNCAAAVLLVLSALAVGREVIVSRGELIEIGGGFRVPDVLARSGARLVEVGTTNKTRLSDYAKALDEAERPAAILRVHQGNFRQTGFVERPELAALAALAHARGVVLIKDLGGGALFDLAPMGLSGEPVARACVAAGADVVCFSTDKILGGPQGGAIVGRADLVEASRRDPLARALRLGRLPLVALEAVLASYLSNELDEVPTIAALRVPLDAVRARATRWMVSLAERGITSEVVPLTGAVGGGALAEAPLASVGLSLATTDAPRVASSLRGAAMPVVARISEGRLLFDARTVMPDEDEALVAAIVWAMTPTLPQTS